MNMDKKAFTNIISTVITLPSSPYQHMMRKVNAIDTDYFESITRDENILSPELNLELKDKVLNDIDEQTNRLLFDSDLMEQILADTRSCLEKEGNAETARQKLTDTAQELLKYAQDRLLFIPTPKYEDEELNRLYEQAKKVTLLEHIAQNNRKDIINFYHALMDRTEWECKALVERKTSQFLTKLAERLTETADTTTPANVTINGYVPQPIDTSDIQLPEELEALVEEMAKNVHEVWAETRIKQGWMYGPERNDKQKKHPCLIPYEELPEEEKEYDRGTSVGTLKLILKLGFRITKE